MSKKLAAGPQNLLRARNGEAPQLLLAEDSPAARILTAALLRRMGCSVDEAEHGEEALEAVRSRAYHAIILDIEMPVMDGITAARAIRGLPDAKSRTPLIALSAFLADSGEARHWRTLFDLTHAKPASREGLRKAVTAMLDLEIDTAPEIQDLSTQHQSLSIIDQSALLHMQAQFPAADWAVLMDQALDEMRDSLKGIHQAMQHQDHPTIRKLSHRMKGLARTFAAPHLAKKAESLEIAADHQTDLQSGIFDLEECFTQTLGKLQAMRAA